jgi:hypothetical protein
MIIRIIGFNQQLIETAMDAFLGYVSVLLSEDLVLDVHTDWPDHPDIRQFDSGYWLVTCGLRLVAGTEGPSLVIELPIAPGEDDDAIAQYPMCKISSDVHSQLLSLVAGKLLTESIAKGKEI